MRLPWHTRCLSTLNEGWRRRQKVLHDLSSSTKLVSMPANAESRDDIVAELQTNGIEASPLRTDHISFLMSASGFEQHSSALVDALKKADEWRKR
jgi:hypothetical protein